MSKRSISLCGNPNSGKSSIFNTLTGLKQRVSNFPGVTVEKKQGTITIGGEEVTLIDLPGTYSLYPNSSEEKVVVDILTNTEYEFHPDGIAYVIDVQALERHLLLLTQLRDLSFPIVALVNMTDTVKNKEFIDEICKGIEKGLGVKSFATTSQDMSSIVPAFEYLMSISANESKSKIKVYQQDLIADIAQTIGQSDIYKTKILIHNINAVTCLSNQNKEQLKKLPSFQSFENIKGQFEDVMQRYDQIQSLKFPNVNLNVQNKTITERIDHIITQPVIGPIVFFVLMLLIFQSVFSWSEWPMTMIENSFALLGGFISERLPDFWMTKLLVEGIIAGLAGVLVFIPQIAILFFFVSLLDESGYMSRAVYMFDPLMRKFGLNGRSMVALISSGACAIPAIMSTRTITNWRERLTTMMVSPLISCSARLPVYAVLIGFVVPDAYWGPFNYRGIVFMGLYLLGIVSAILSAIIISKTIKDTGRSSLLIELPSYKKPIWKNVHISVRENVKSFIWNAGKIIMVVSIILWFLGSYGPKGKMQQAQINVENVGKQQNWTDQEIENRLQSAKLEASYAGIMGKFIEPVIAPLGFDWKIGIALITSFAAREVFVGTMATIYSVGAEAEESTVREKMAREYKANSTIKMYNPATALSLLVFYVFAMQCMSTLAVMKKETNGYKWPTIQFIYMGMLAYLGSWITYQLMS